jgi:hypothetical protein
MRALILLFIKNNTMKYFLSFLVFLSVSLSFAQTNIKKSSISTAGGTQTAGTTQVVYTVGEVAVNENTTGVVHLSEGFIGSDILQALGVSDYTELNGIAVFPIPVQSELNIELPNHNEYKVYIYNLSGKQLVHFNINNSYTYDMSNYTTGVYLLIIIDDNNKRIKQVKVEKK